MDPKLILKNKGLLISSVFILTILILEVIFRDTLVDFSIEIIIHLQTKLPNFMRYIFHTVAGLADPDIILPVYLLSLSLQVNKFFLVKVGIYISSIGYFLSVVKTIYANPRPYWIRPYMEDLPGYIPPGIQPFEKYAEYGNPSGHAFFSIAFYGYLFYVFIKNQQKKQLKASANRSQERLIDEENPEIMTQEKNINMPAEETVGFSARQSKPFSKFVFRALFVVFSLGVALVGTSRLYLGMHTLNQVLLGMSLGTFYMYIFIKYIDQPLENFLKTIAKQELNDRPLTIWLYSVCYLIASLLPIVLYIQKSQSNSLIESDTWSKWWIVIKNELKTTPPNAFAYIRCLLDSGVVGGFFGIILGALASDGSYTETSPKFRTIPKMMIFFRVLVFFIVAAIPAGVLALIPVPEQNYILTYFLNWNLALFMAGFSATRFVPIAYAKFNLDIEGDFLRFRNVHVNNTLSIS